jgi:hypothetical protein
MKSDNGVIDLRKIQCMAEWPQAIDSFESVCVPLEEYIAPHVSSRKTEPISEFSAVLMLEFRGKRRYLKSGAPQAVITAAYALSWLYRALAAIQVGDTDQAIRSVFAYAKADAEFWSHAVIGCSATEAMVEHGRHKMHRIKSRLGKTELSGVPDLALLTAVAKHRNGNRVRIKPLTADINNQFQKQVTTKTVSRELKRRGIVDKST